MTATTTTTPTNTPTNTTALLRSLERDFSGKRSVQDCLRRSRALPAAHVKKLLLLNDTSSKKIVVALDQQAFRLSFASLLTENLGVAKNAYNNNNSSSQKSQQQQDNDEKKNKKEDEDDSDGPYSSSSSMWYISKLSTVFYFIQLLWEYENCSKAAAAAAKPKEHHNDDEENENDQHANRQRQRPNNSSSSSSVSSVDSSTSSSRPASSKSNAITVASLPPEQANKMILQLLRSITGVACTLCEKHHELQQQQQQQHSLNTTTKNDDEEEDNVDECDCFDYYTSNATRTFHGLQVASFLLMNLIRFNHYVRLRPVFISPLWKAIGDVVTAICMPASNTSTNMTMTSMTTLLPRDIWIQGVSCLTDYLVEGTVPTLKLFCASWYASTTADLDRIELQQQQEQQNFQTKVLGFLLGRLLVFFKAYNNNIPPPQQEQQSQQQVIFMKVLEILCILRGVDHAQLASKVDRCIKALLLKLNHDQQQQQQQQQQFFQDVVVQHLVQCSHKHAVQVLLQQANSAASSDNNKDDVIADLATPFYFHGHCWLLLQPLQVVLDTTATTKKDDGSGSENASLLHHTETLFRVMEHVIFCALPACSQDLWTTAMTSASLSVDTNNSNDSSFTRAAAAAKKSSSLKHLLLPRCLNLWFQLLLRYESSLCCSPCQQQQQRRQALHHLLAGWLGRAEHPLTREVMLVLVHGHVQNLLALHVETTTTTTAIIAAAAEPLVRLLAKLLYDQRTKLQLRRSLASLFVRFLLHDSSQHHQQQEKQTTTGVTKTTMTVKLFAETILVDELDKSSHLGTMTTTMTPSTLSTGAKRKRTRGKSPSSLSSKPLTAADILVVGQVLSMLPSDASSRRILAECLEAGLEPNHRRLGPLTVALLRSDAAGEEATTVRDLVMKFSKLWATQSSTITGARCTENSSSSRRSSSLTSLGVALFRYLYKSCLKSMELQPQQATVLVQAICHVFRCILERNNNNGQQLPLHQQLVVVMLEGIRVLRVVSRVLSSNTPKAVVDQLARIFHQLLSQKEWAVRAHAMSSLVLFASTVQPAHKHVLPACLPNNMTSLLQCRLKGSALHQGSLSTSDVLSMQRQCAQKMFSLVQFDAGTIPPCGEGSIFPTCSSSVVIPVGSLVVRMKIHAPDSNNANAAASGRTALVIFPPGEQSMEDIEYMQGDSEDPYTIEKMYRMQSVQGGFKMYLKE